MFTVIPNTRNSNLYLIGAIALVIAVFLTIANMRPLAPASTAAKSPVSWLGSPAFYEYRRGEWASGAVAASSIGSAAFYEYRRGEWSTNFIQTDPEISRELFRQGERNARLSPDLRDFSNYQHRQGEWFGK